MILPEPLNLIFGIVGLTLFTSLFVIISIYVYNENFQDWVCLHAGKFFISMAIIALISAIMIAITYISSKTRQEQKETIRKEQLQEQCVEYHNNHPDNWVVCPVCEEKLD